MIGQPQLGQQRRGCFLGVAQRLASLPYTSPEFPLQVQLLLQASELTPRLFSNLGSCAEVTNLLPASVTEPQLHHLFAWAPPLARYEPALLQGPAVFVGQCEPSERGELGGEITRHSIAPAIEDSRRR